MKTGDRVKVVDESDYNKMLLKNGVGSSSIGLTGTIVETRYNSRMAIYGRGNEVMVRLDNDQCVHLFCDIDLLITN